MSYRVPTPDANAPTPTAALAVPDPSRFTVLLNPLNAFPLRSCTPLLIPDNAFKALSDISENALPTLSAPLFTSSKALPTAERG